jgi:integrase
MSLFRPTYTEKKAGALKESAVWWYEFTYAGKRIRESAQTTRKTIAGEKERNRRLELEKTSGGVPAEKRDNKIRSVSDVIGLYLKRYELDHRGREKSILFAKGRLANVTRLIGRTLLPDLTEDAVRAYATTRLDEGASGRTVNMELGELSRAIGKKWSILWPTVRKQEERKDVGKALSPEDEAKLLKAATEQKSPNRSQTLATFIRIALLTGMRSGEISALTWGQIDFTRRVVTVGRAKTAAGTGREIPMNSDLFSVFSMHAGWFEERFGLADSEHYIFPFGKPTPNDPTKPIRDVTGAWKALRKTAGVQCRLHDLRHTAATKMAEAGVPESTMLALLGHMSRAMLERYSHIRMARKREAVEALSFAPKDQTKSNGVPQESPKVEDSLPVM